MDTTRTPDSHATYDVVVIGGGPAGLQAALTLGRMHRRTLVLDAGSYRNDPADAAHNFLTRDGIAPGELRRLARAELGAYATVTVRAAAVGSVSPATPVSPASSADGDFVVTVDGDDGPSAVRARTVLLATGLRDTLPDVPGLERVWGSAAAHCPFCHGHEYAGTHVGVLGSHAHVDRVSLLMLPIAARISVLTDGAVLDPALDRTLRAAGVDVLERAVTQVRPTEGGLRVSFDGAPDLDLGGLMVAPTFAQAAPFAEQLGLTLLASGCVEVDAVGRTSRAGVYAAGDLAHSAVLPMPASSVLAAAAAGQAAAGGIVAELIARDHPAA